MFKPQPLRYAFVFTATIFCSSLVFLLLILHRATYQLSLGSVLILIGSSLLSALMSGAFYWLGLCLSHREPIPKRAAFCAVFLYVMSYNIQQLFGESAFGKWIGFSIILLFPFIFALRWPQSYSIMPSNISDQNDG